MYSTASVCMKNSAVIRASMCCKVTIVVFGLFLLTSSTPLAHNKDTRGGEYLSLVADQPGASAVFSESHSGPKKALQIQLGNPETGIPKETVTVDSKKRSRSAHHKSSHSLPHPPVLATDAASSPTEVAGASDTARRSLKHVSRHIFSRMRRTIRLQRTTATRRSYSGKMADDSAAFHVDYSGPKTHPPRNN